MLVEIKCDIFKNKIVNFHSGLNVVLGDENASNSIGKSNLLLIVDFVFGGETYLTHSSDVVQEIGHHEFYFCFEFDKRYKFKRTTNNAENLFQCNENYEILKSISLSEFTTFLQNSYGINYVDSTFRALVSLYIRVWGKYNYDIKKPLKTYENDGNEKLGIYNLIKLFNKYNELKEINDRINKDTDSKKTITSMYRSEYATKITKAQYNKNQREIENISNEIEDIKQNILKYVVNVEELIDKELLELKKEKNKLLDIKNDYENRLLRINRNLDSKSNLSSKHLQKLQEFFPNSNIPKIEEIEQFHIKIKNILASEIKKTKEDLEYRISIINNGIDDVDKRISDYLQNTTNPNVIIDKVYDLTIMLNEIRNTNKIYSVKITKEESIKLAKDELYIKLETIIDDIRNSINAKMIEINVKIYNNKNSPIINIEKNSYSLVKPNDTGTGTSYMNLLIFDLAILQLTNLPLIVHDSVLFKNIENHAMENLIKFYDEFEKQIFIAVDEHKKYSNVVSILEKQQVIKLDSENVLFIKKWSKT